MNLDYLIPLATGIVMLSTPCLLLASAWRQRPTHAPLRRGKAHHYRPSERQAYSQSRAKVQVCLAVSLFGTLVAGLGIAIWLPLASVENALLATLAGPLFWAAGLVILLARSRWRRDCLLTMGIAISALIAALIPLAGG